MSTPSISRQFAHWAAGLRYEDLSPAVIDKVKALMLHGLTSVAFGTLNPQSREVVDLVILEEGKADGATVLGDGRKATRVGSAFANAELMHASLLWDSYRMLTHPGPVLISAAMVNAELEGKNGQDIITALAAGYEFSCRLCDKFIPSTAARGFRPSPIYATMGAAMVTAKLMGFDEDRLVATIALAANFASGLNEGPRSGGDELAIHEPQAARNGVFAGLMAKAGHVKGSEKSIEGEAGFYNAFTGNNKGKLTYSFTGSLQFDPSAITQGLGQEYKLLSVMFRMYPCPGYNQAVINLMTELKLQHSINPDEIANVDIHMNWIETLYPSPEFPLYEDWQKARVGETKYFAAHAAVNGGVPVVGGRTFGPTGKQLKSDQRVLDFMEKHITLIPEKDRPMFSPAIHVTMNNGARYSGEYPYSRMEWDFQTLADNLQACTVGYPGGKTSFDKLVEITRQLDTLKSVSPIIELTAQK